MISKSIKYKDLKDLESFIKLNNFFKEKSLLVQIFSGCLDYDILKNISSFILKTLPNAKIIGATTDGEIKNNEILTNSIIINFSSFTKTTISISYEENLSIDKSYDVGIKLSKSLIKDNSKGFILFADGLNTNGEELLNGIKSISNNITISGGLAGDNAKFKKTYVLCNDKVLENSVVGVSLNSDILNVYTNYTFAWENIGREFIVNKSVNERVYEIDGMTPYDLYSKYLGKNIANLLPGISIEFPLIIQNKNLPIARAALSRHDDDSITFAGNIKEGSIVRFGVGNSEMLLKDATKLALTLSKINTEATFIYSCMARRRFLDNMISCDINALSKISDITGFFTYGEFYSSKDKLYLLNESMTILSLSEDNKKIDKSETIKNEILKYNNHKSTKFHALSHLVNIFSDELNELNKNLETRVYNEIEKNKDFEKRLFTSKKMASLGDMISNIAHQWRQPLSIITTSASGMQLHKELGILSDETFTKYTEIIVSQSQYLSETIDLFRNYIQDNHIFTDIVVQKEIKSTLKLLDSVFKDNNIKLIQNIDYDNELKFKLISGELSQVIINIINNAKDAFIQRDIQNRQITISLSTNKTICTISIEDNAQGIPEHIISKIFEPYFTTKKHKNGTGIGLYMSYDMITKHLKGELYVKNTKNGAKFTIEVPMNITETKI